MLPDTLTSSTIAHCMVGYINSVLLLQVSYLAVLCRVDLPSDFRHLDKKNSTGDALLIFHIKNTTGITVDL